MEIEYELTEDDWLAVGHALAKEKISGRQSASQLVSAALKGVILAAALLVLAIYGFHGDSSRWDLLPAFGAGLFSGMSSWLFMVAYNNTDNAVRRTMRRIAETGTGFDPFARRTVSMAASRVSESSASFSRSLAWSRIARLEQTPNHLLIFGAILPDLVSAIVVPRRAFATERDFNDFSQLAHRHWQAAGSGLMETTISPS